MQNWASAVVKDRDLKRQIGEHNRQHSPFRSAHAIYPNLSDTRMRSASQHLDEHIHDAPVLILACIQHDGSASDIGRGASINPAVQNMLLAARARTGFEKEIKEILGIPENVDTAGLLPLGYPKDGTRYGPTHAQACGRGRFQRRVGSEVAGRELIRCSLCCVHHFPTSCTDANHAFRSRRWLSMRLYTFHHDGRTALCGCHNRVSTPPTASTAAAIWTA